MNSPRVTGWILVAMAVICTAFAALTYDNAVALRDHGVVATGEVLEVHGGKNSHVVLRFQTASGQIVVAEVGNYSWSPKPKVGDRPTILYDPQQPADNVADTRTGPDFLATWFLAGGALIAALLIRPTFTGRLNWMRFSR